MCERTDGSHGEADDDFADVRSLRIAQGGMLDRRESTGCMKSCAENHSTANQQDLSSPHFSCTSVLDKPLVGLTSKYGIFISKNKF